MWSAQAIQAVWFTLTADLPRADDIYSAFFKDSPDSYNFFRQPNPADPIQSTARGYRGQHAATINVRSGRIDLILEPLSAHNSPAPQLMDTETAIAALENVVVSSGFPLDLVYRLSVVLNLVRPVNGSLEASQEILAATGLHLPDPNVSDLQFQLNRRKSLRDGIAINRIMRFETALGQEFVLANPTLGMPQQTQQVINHYAAVLSIDLNSVPTGEMLTSESEEFVFRQLTDEARSLSHSAKLGALFN